MHDETRAAHLGRAPERFHGAVNPPVYHVSTVLSKTLAEYEQKRRDWVAETPGVYYYGRHGMPTTEALQQAIADLEGGHKAVVYPSGLAACAGALLSCLAAGDHLLMTDTAYGPTRTFAKRVLGRYGVETTFYDPLVGAGIADLMRANTKAVFVESPGSLTFEMQDIPAIAEVAHARGAAVVMDNTWGTPIYYKAFEHGVDLSVQSATKYIVGHADAMVGVVTANKAWWPKLKTTTYDFGQACGPDDIYFALRGLRTLPTRLKQHWESGVHLAEWIARQPEVERVLHPALPGDPGHALWKRDFKGACGLFSVVLKPVKHEAFAALVDGLELYGIGASWGGFESLIAPFDPREVRSATKWPYPGPCFRIHAGLENIGDLIADMDAGFRRLRERA